MSEITAKVLGWLSGIVRKPVFWLCAALAVAIVLLYDEHTKLIQTRNDAARIKDNQAVLLGQMKRYRTENGELAASVSALSLKANELEDLIPKYVREISQLKVDLRNAKNMAHVSTETTVNIVAPLQPESPSEADSTATDWKVVNDETKTPPAGRDFSWSDEWVSVAGKVYPDTVVCTFVSIDSLLLVAHYQKRKCLFRKWRKGKLIKYDVTAKNPHTDIKSIEYIEVVE